MKISIDKNVLIEALDTVSKAIASKSTLQILEGVLLEANKDYLRLTGNDLETAIKHTVKCEVLETGSTVVNANLFFGIVRKMPDEEIDIRESNGKMVIECGSSVMNINALNPKGYPDIPEVELNDSFTIEQQLLKEMIGKVAFAADPTGSNPSLKGVFINIVNGSLDMVASDGFMMAGRRSSITAESRNILIPAKIFEPAAKVLTHGDMTVGIGKNQVVFETDNTKISLRTLDATYMNYKNWLNLEFETSLKVNTRELQSSLERSLLLISDIDRRNTYITFNVKTDSLKLSLKSSMGDFEDNIPVDTSGNNIKIRLSPQQVYECMKRIEDKEVLLKFIDNSSPCYMLPVEGDKFFYITTPIREK